MYIKLIQCHHMIDSSKGVTGAPGLPVFRLSTDFRIRGFLRLLDSVLIKSSKITVGGLEEKTNEEKKFFWAPNFFFGP